MNRAKNEIYKKENELSIFKNVYEWFEKNLDINFPNRPISDYSYFSNHNNKNEICRVIKALGTGITNYNEISTSMSQLQKVLPKELFDKLEDDIKNLTSSCKNYKEYEDIKSLNSISIRANDMYFVITVNGNCEVEIKTIVFNHGNESPTFDFSEESDGTRRILDLLEILFCTESKTYIIDEIDRSLHPQLTYKFIQEFMTIAKARNIQLIITTHESRLLDFGLLRQDEVWIVNKNLDGESEIYSLDEYNVRFDQKVDKAYLEGRYGGVPVFSTIFPLEEE